MLTWSSTALAAVEHYMLNSYTPYVVVVGSYIVCILSNAK